MSLNVRTGTARDMDKLEQELLELGYKRAVDDIETEDLGILQYKRHGSQELSNVSSETQGRETIVWRDSH